MRFVFVLLNIRVRFNEAGDGGAGGVFCCCFFFLYISRMQFTTRINEQSMLINRWIVYANLIAELLCSVEQRENRFNTYQIAYFACVPCPCHIFLSVQFRSDFFFLFLLIFCQALPSPHTHTHTHTQPAYVSKALCFFKLTKRMRAPHCCSVGSSFNCFCFASLCYHISFPPSCPGIYSFLFVTRCARSFSFPLNSYLFHCRPPHIPSHPPVPRFHHIVSFVPFWF